MAWQEENDARRVQPEDSEVHQPPPLGILAKARRPDTADVDSLPNFTHGKAFRRIIVSPAGADRRHVVTGVPQTESQIGEMLRRGDMIWLEALIQKKDAHG
jgi:hypothetical protein